jgi:uncharacterized membrane protein YccC
MTQTKVALLTNSIKDSMNAMANTHLMVKELLQETDLRHVTEHFAEEMGKSLQASLHDLEKAHERHQKAIASLAAILYYKELELNKGSKGEWRQIAKDQAHYRVSIDAIRSLRETFGMNLIEARLVVNGFNAGMFE